MFRLNRTYGLGGDVVWRISRWWPSWISEGNDFSNSESLCLCDASHQVLTQSDLRFGRRCHLKTFNMTAMEAILDIGMEQYYSESLCHCDDSHQVSTQSNLWFGRWCRLKNFKMGTMAAVLDIILAILNLYVTVMHPIKFWLNPTYGLGGDVLWRISRWPQWRPSWISERYNFSNFESLPHCDATIKFQLNRTYGLGGDVIWRISRWWPSWISELNNSSHSDSLCLCDASHQVLTQSDLRFGRTCCFKNFKMATMAAVLDTRTEQF